MARGKPRLATWTDGTLRVYELSETGFVQVFAAAAPRGSTIPADRGNISWNSSGDTVYCTLPADFTSQRLVHQFNLRLALNSQITMSGITNMGFLGWSFINYHKGLVDYPRRYSLDTNEFISAANSTTTLPSLTTAGYEFLKAFLVAKSGAFFFRGLSSASYTNMISFASATNSETSVNYGQASQVVLPTGFTVFHGKLSADDKYVYVAGSSVFRYGRINIIERTFTNFDPISDAFGTPWKIAVSRSVRYVAFSYKSAGGAHKTVIYRRAVDDLIPVTSIENFGALLDFTEDGKLLVDAQTRKAYAIDASGLATESVGFLGNVIAGVEVAAMSPHIDQPSGYVTLYDYAVAAITFQTADLGNLKLALLDSAATFNRTHTTLAQVTESGAREVSGFGWPVGGKLIPNAGFVSIAPNTIGLAASSITQVLNGELNFAKAVIYDDSHVDDRPLAFVEFSEAQTINEGAELILNFSGSGPFLISD